MKFIILQDVPYRRPEGALAQYHGAIWAEELRRRGHEATKMVLGDPHAFVPESPLLSMSTNAQRVDPSFWNNVKADCVLYYANPSTDCVRVVKAIKKGSPATLVISRIEAFWAPTPWPLRRARASFVRRYIEARHCPTERFDFEKRSVPAALARTFAGTIRSLLDSSLKNIVSIVETSDRTTFFFPRLVEEARDFFRLMGRTDLARKIEWCGYPVRSQFQPPPHGKKESGSVISIANWRHVKDPELTADAMVIALRKNRQASYLVVGERSDRVADRIRTTAPDIASRIKAFEHVDNRELPGLLAKSQVFLLCSFKEGISSVLSEALCCGCSLALATGPAVGVFQDYLTSGIGTQSSSRSAADMARATLVELEAWRNGMRNALSISQKWDCTHVSSLCSTLFGRDKTESEGSGLQQ